MSEETPGAVTLWLDNLKAGGDAAAQTPWERYFDRLVRLARAQTCQARRVPRVVLTCAPQTSASTQIEDNFWRLDGYPQVPATLCAPRKASLENFASIQNNQNISCADNENNR